jgi:hypothetical protein
MQFEVLSIADRQLPADGCKRKTEIGDVKSAISTRLDSRERRSYRALVVGDRIKERPWGEAHI